MLGLSYMELSESLGVKESTIRVRCFRAKEKLREILSGAEERFHKNGCRLRPDGSDDLAGGN